MALREALRGKRLPEGPEPLPSVIMVEEFENKMEHRFRGIAGIKKTPEYRHKSSAMLDRPKTPDPYDRHRWSKRLWENTIVIWRKALKELQPPDETAVPPTTLAIYSI